MHWVLLAMSHYTYVTSLLQEEMLQTRTMRTEDTFGLWSIYSKHNGGTLCISMKANIECLSFCESE